MVGKVHADAILVYSKVIKICIITRISDDLLCCQVNLVEIDIVIKDDEVRPLFLTLLRYLAWAIRKCFGYHYGVLDLALDVTSLPSALLVLLGGVDPLFEPDDGLHLDLPILL